MGNKPFKFKQFTIHQNRCAMKVGTDGVLLGAWTNISHNPFSILDIGAGTGLIALMLAQRSSSEIIDAIEIDADAYEQCVENFESSPWNNRLFCYHASLNEFVEEVEDKYDLITSNPPYFKPHSTSKKEEFAVSSKRAKARFYDALPFDELLESVSKLLSDDGKFCTIIPFAEEASFTQQAKNFGLHANKILRVKGTPEAEVKRSLIEFSLAVTPCETSEISIETSRHIYTDDYCSLTKNFYLKM